MAIACFLLHTFSTTFNAAHTKIATNQVQQQLQIIYIQIAGTIAHCEYALDCVGNCMFAELLKQLKISQNTQKYLIFSSQLRFRVTKFCLRCSAWHSPRTAQCCLLLYYVTLFCVSRFSISANVAHFALRCARCPANFQWTQICAQPSYAQPTSSLGVANFK